VAVNDKKRIQAILKGQGYYMEIDKWPQKLTFYKPNGEPLPNLPADPWSMERYLKKGFTLTPPVPKPIVPSNGENLEIVGATAQEELIETLKIVTDVIPEKPKTRKPRKSKVKKRESKKRS